MRFFFVLKPLEKEERKWKENKNDNFTYLYVVKHCFKNNIYFQRIKIQRLYIFWFFFHYKLYVIAIIHLKTINIKYLNMCDTICKIFRIFIISFNSCDVSCSWLINNTKYDYNYGMDQIHSNTVILFTSSSLSYLYIFYNIMKTTHLCMQTFYFVDRNDKIENSFFF